MRLVLCVCLHLCVGLTFVVTASPIRNKYATTVELFKFFTFGGNQKCSVYDFTPSDFSFSSTSNVYKLELCPRRAVPHEVVVFYQKPIGFRNDIVVKALTNFSASLTIKHEGEKKKVALEPMAKCPCHGAVVGGNSSGLVHELFRFKVGDFRWRYDDRIELLVEVCSPAEDIELFSKTRMKLKLQEGWIIR